MLTVASSQPSIKSSRKRRAKPQGAVIVRALDRFAFLRRHVDSAERYLERARSARTADERTDALRMARAMDRTTRQMFSSWWVEPCMRRHYAAQESRLKLIARAADDVEREARLEAAAALRQACMVIDLAKVRARRAASSHPRLTAVESAS